MRLVPGLSRTVGYAAGGTLALGLLVAGCVFAGMAGPALSLHTRTQALQQTMAGLSDTTKTVQMSTDWGDFTSGLSGTNDNFGIGVAENLNLGVLNLATDEMARGLAATPLPLGPGRWASLTTNTLEVLGAGPRAQAGGTPRVEVVYRDPLTSNTRVVAGSYASPPGLPAGTVAVAATQQMAARFGLHPGSRLRIPAQGGILINVYVTAVVAKRDPGSTFWNQDILVGTPELNTPTNGQPYWAGGLIADPSQLAVMQNQFSGPGMEVSWEFPLDTSRVNADQAQGLYNALNHAVQASPALTGRLTDSASTLTVTSPLISDLSVFLATQTAIQTVLLLLFVSLIVVGAAVIVLAARMIAARRHGELSMLRARGGSLRQVAAMMLRAALITTVPAAAIGVALAIAVVPGGSVSSPAGWWLAAITVAAALAGPPLIAAWQHLRPRSGPASAARSYPGREDRARSRIAGLRRLVLEVAAVAASVAGLVMLHDEGVPAGGGINWFLTATPVLVAVPVVIIVLRLYPLAVRVVLRLSSRRAGATGFVALAGAARSSLTGVLPAFALVLALSLATFAGMVSQAISRGEIAASWQATGADVAITATSAPVSPAAEKAVASVPGVQHLTATWNTSWVGPGGQPVTVVAVDPRSYAAFLASTPFAAVPLAKLHHGTAGPVPVLASPAAVASLGGSAAQITAPVGIGPVRVRVAGTVTAIPGQPAGSAFLIMPIQRLPGPQGIPAVNRILITGGGISTAAMSAVVGRQLPGASTAFRSVALAALAGSPLQHGAGLILPLAIATAAGFGLFILMLGVALGTADRALTLARLTVMGHERATRLVLLEALPAVVVAVAAGAACALALPPLVGSALDLSVFAGSGVPVTLRPDWISLGLPAAAAVLLAAAALATEARRLSRRGVARMLRAE